MDVESDMHWRPGGGGRGVPTPGRERILHRVFGAGRGFWLVFLGVLMAWHCHDFGAVAAEVPDLEYKVKAGFVFNFFKFVQWPESSFTTPTSPFVLGIFSSDPSLSALEQVLRGKQVNGRPVLVKPLSNVEEGQACHLVFLSRAEKRRVSEMLNTVKHLPVVTVSEIEGFAQDGGIVNFVLRDGSVRLEINLEAAERVGLKISAKLSSVGSLVKPKKP